MCRGNCAYAINVIFAWSGHGYLAAVILLAAFGAVAASKNALPAGVSGMSLAALSLAFSGIATAAWGYFVNRGPAAIAIDPFTGWRRTIRTRHSFYWIPVQYWGIAELVLAVVLFLMGSGQRG